MEACFLIIFSLFRTTIPTYSVFIIYLFFSPFYLSFILNNFQLLRAVFEHLSISSKCDLLTTLQSSLKNSNRSTPLPNSTVHFRTRIRQLFNRLVVSDVNSGDDNYDNNQQVLNLFNKDVSLC